MFIHWKSSSDDFQTNADFEYGLADFEYGLESHFLVLSGPFFFISLNMGGWHALSVLILEKPVFKIKVYILL